MLIFLLEKFNCPTSVVYSAVIYCLRALVDMDIPLNQGCLVPITIKIPPHSLLDPHPTAAVVGGNVTTSQRITDVVLRAFEACGASQGCCNNFTFGAGGKGADGQHIEGWGYYETICGGTGAGESWDGVTCHSHMVRPANEALYAFLADVVISVRQTPASRIPRSLNVAIRLSYTSSRCVRAVAATVNTREAKVSFARLNSSKTCKFQCCPNAGHSALTASRAVNPERAVKICGSSNRGNVI